MFRVVRRPQITRSVSIFFRESHGSRKTVVGCTDHPHTYLPTPSPPSPRTTQQKKTKQNKTHTHTHTFTHNRNSRTRNKKHKQLPPSSHKTHYTLPHKTQYPYCTGIFTLHPARGHTRPVGRSFLIQNKTKQNTHTGKPTNKPPLEVSLSGVGTVLRLERDAWSMAK